MMPGVNIHFFSIGVVLLNFICGPISFSLDSRLRFSSYFLGGFSLLSLIPTYSFAGWHVDISS